MTVDDRDLILRALVSGEVKLDRHAGMVSLRIRCSNETLWPHLGGDGFPVLEQWHRDKLKEAIGADA